MLEFKEVTGGFVNYTVVMARDDYCFYDVDLPKEERNYMTLINTPILDKSELERKFIEVQGSADELNQLTQKEREEKEKINGNE